MESPCVQCVLVDLLVGDGWEGIRGVQRRIQDFGGGGGLIIIVTSGGGYGWERGPSCDSQGVWGKAPAAILTFALI